MNRDQVNALEEWIVAIVADECRHSDLIDARRRRECKDEVERVFSLDAQPNG